MEEQELITLCKSGKAKAQKVLYERYATKMFRVCFRYVKIEADAEDVLINAFMKVFKNIHKFEYRGKGCLEGWIRRIMVNEALMHLRKNNNFNLVSESYAHSLDANIEYDSKFAAEEIYALILKLPTGYRTVFNLYVIEGFSHKEIAEQLGVSVSTSKTQLHKARNQLQKLLVKYQLVEN